MPTLNLDEFGKITYTIDKSGFIGPNDYVTMKFTFKPSVKMYGYRVYVHNPSAPNQGAYPLQSGDKTISKGGSGSVTIEFNPAQYIKNRKWFTERSAQLLMSVDMIISTSDDYASSEIFDTGVTVLEERIAPVISNPVLAETTFNDTAPVQIFPPPAENLPFNIFGMFVQGVSKPKFTADITLDPLDTTLTANYTLALKQGDTELYSAAGGVSGNSIKILTGLISAYGAVDCILTVTDSAGMSASTTVSFTVLQYSKPSISLFTPKRYEYAYNASGNQILQESESGTIVIFDFAGSITPISGNGANNFGKLSVTYGPTYDESDRTTVVINSTTNASTAITHEFAGVVFSDSEDYTFVASFNDYFNSAKSTVEIYKAGGDLDVTPDGAAVGMISTGTAEHKKFEVAETHESFFYGGIAGVTNYPAAGVEELTGGKWIDGKPIYRFLWKGTTTHKKTQKVMTNFPNDITPDTVISLTGMLKRSDGEWMPIPNAYYGSADHTANLRTYGGNGIYLGLGDGFDGTKTVVIIAEYTKK